MRYFDASALVKRYVREAGSATVRHLLSSDMAAVSRLSAVEIASACARRTREGRLSERSLMRVLSRLHEDMASLLVVELTDDVTARSTSLLRRHPLRAGDAVQLASCLHLREALGQDVSMVVYDTRLRTAAKQEGLTLD